MGRKRSLRPAARAAGILGTALLAASGIMELTAGSHHGPAIGTEITAASAQAQSAGRSTWSAETRQMAASNQAVRAREAAGSQRERLRKEEAARQAAAAAAAARQAQIRAAEAAAARPPPPPFPPSPAPAETPQQIATGMLAAAGESSQFGCLNALWTRESGWSVTAENPDGAYGIPQALPGDKMESAGSGWETSAVTQITWGLGYIRDTYGTPCGAWDHEEQTGWY